MNFLNIDIMALTQAVMNAGWEKSMNVNDDGSIEWHGESGYPTNQEIYTEIDKLVTDWTYLQAKARLAQYQVALGREEVTENQATGEKVFNDETGEIDDVMGDIIIATAIDPVEATVEVITHDDEGIATTSTVENPLITQDNAERAEAQAIVDATPQSVIDTYED
jgi:hypothetical protein